MSNKIVILFVKIQQINNGFQQTVGQQKYFSLTEMKRILRNLVRVRVLQK